jgi:hypothetical protein
MRRSKAFKRGRWFSILVAGLIGFLLGNWHAASTRPTDISPSQNVALRFPEAKAETALANAAELPTGAIATGSMIVGDAQLALLNPDPMVPPPVRQPAVQMPQQPVQAAVPQDTTPVPLPAPKAVAGPRPAPPRTELNPMSDAAARHAGRPGFLLNDAQIASIKSRLHLTPDQEQMWPAVEAALRNVAYAKTREAHRRATPGRTDVASLDPDEAAVLGLKSAAIPLIMSFSDEQKNEVRSLAHVMGLDKLASEL